MNDLSIQQLKSDLSSLRERVTAIETNQNMIPPAVIVEFKGAVLNALENLDKDMDQTLKVQKETFDKMDSLEKSVLTLKIKFGIPFSLILLLSIVFNIYRVISTM